MGELLRVSDLGKAFGAHHALASVSFTLRPGEIVGLLGPNGSGKSTLLNIITGFLSSDRGSISFHDVSVIGRTPEAIARLGLVRTFQLPAMPSRMTVEECLLSASRSTIERLPLKSKRAVEDTQNAEQLLHDLSLADKRHERASALSGGQRKLLSVAMALQTRPRLLCLDEPTAGVHPHLRAGMIQLLRRQREAGTDLLIVEHDMNFIRDLCARCLVLDRGHVIADCAPQELTNRPHVVEAYLGKSIERRRALA
jgi:branched-chain amino acid transport system ATP-binding protein